MLAARNNSKNLICILAIEEQCALHDARTLDDVEYKKVLVLGFVYVRLGAALRRILLQLVARYVRQLCETDLWQYDKQKNHHVHREIEKRQPSYQNEEGHDAGSKVAFDFFERVTPQLHFCRPLGPFLFETLPKLAALPLELIQTLKS